MDYLNRRLRHFYILATQRSVTAAARRLHLTPAALSISIKTLEQEIGQSLFERLPRKMILTEKGRSLFEFLNNEDRGIQERLQSALKGDTFLSPALRIGVVSHLASRYVLPHMGLLEKNLGPIQFLGGYSHQIYESVRMDTMDFGIITWTTVPQGVKYKALRNDAEAIVGLKGKFDHIKKIKSVTELRNERWIWHRKPQKPWHEYLTGNEAGVVADTYEAMKTLLFSGWGIADVQLEFFSDQERKLLVQAPVRFPTHAVVYLIHRPQLTEKQKAGIQQVLKLISK